MKALATKNHGKESFTCSDFQPPKSLIDAANIYLTCIKRLKPLFEDNDFRNLNPSIYINFISSVSSDDKSSYGTVRLNYFSNDGEKTKRIIDDFIRTQSNNLKLLQGGDFQKDPIDNGKTVPGEENEERWRNFCRAYSYIGLDLLYYDILFSRKLALDYRLNYFSKGLPAKQLFEIPFKNHSSFFNNKLDSDYPVEKLWEDLDRYVKGYGPWNHFLINMLLPGEPTEFFQEIDYSRLTEEEKLYISKALNLDLSGEWDLERLK